MSTGTIRFFANSLARQATVNFVIPNDVMDYLKEGNPHYQRPMKSVYLLHGYTGDQEDWLLYSDILNLSIEYNVAFFTCTTQNNFYLDREADGQQNGRFVGQELVDFTRKVFALSDKKEDTFIAGYSMGGYGALKAALDYPEQFSAIISLSPALITKDISKIKEGERPLIANYAYYKEVFGPIERLQESNNNLTKLYLDKQEAGQEIPYLYMAMGTEDYLYESMKEFMQQIPAKEGKVEYDIQAGDHNWQFWNKHFLIGLKKSLER